jgi:hypothetical protein
MTSPLGLRHAAGPLAVAALLVSTPAPAPLCVDAKGHKVYQQSPCPDLHVRSGIEPVAAETLTEKDVLETLKRFDAAMVKRDVPAVASFLDENFKAVAYAVDPKAKDAPPRRLDGYNRQAFVNAFDRSANVISKYQTRRSNCKVTLEEFEATAVCDTQESIVVTSHTGRAQSKEHARLVVRKGRVLLRSLDQYTHDVELTTQSIPAR